MTTLLEARNLTKHFPLRRGLFGSDPGAVRAVDGSAHVRGLLLDNAEAPLAITVG